MFSENAVGRPNAEDWGKEIHKLIVNAEPKPQPRAQTDAPPVPKSSPKPSPLPPPQPPYTPKPTSKPEPATRQEEQSSDFSSSLFSFRGRSRRSRYCLTIFVIVLLDLLSCGIASIIAGGDESGVAVMCLLFQFPLLWMCLANCVKRLHDLGKDGAWVLLALIPLVNLGLAVYLLFFEGEHADNEYGPSPY